jgi:large subunit ribosomal protein L17
MRKLGKRTDLRVAVLRNLASELLWYGRLETTVEKAKEVRKIAEKMVTLAIRTHDDKVKVAKNKTNLKGDTVAVEFENDGPRKLAARRRIMAVLRDLQEPRLPKETKSAYAGRTRDINHPLVEKVFREYASKYEKRNAGLKNSTGGGYTRIIKLGPRRGDAAEMCILEMV